LIGMAALLACMAAGVAMAADNDLRPKQCTSDPCEGNANENLLYEQKGTVEDHIWGYQAHDVLDANNFNFDHDVLRGGDNGDKLLSNDGDGRDVIRGGKGRDVCYIDRGDRTRNCNVVRVRSAGKDATVAEDAAVLANQ
jgi:hypothetical protein